MDDEDFELDTNEEDETGTDDVSAEETAAEKYKPAYPVNFSAKNGDTTSQAFAKHINEIVRIYGLLAGIDASTIDAGAVNTLLQNHINSTNPHPNWVLKPLWSNVQNKPTIPSSLSNLSGTLPFSKITGDIPAARVVGDLVNATISADKVTNLSSVVSGITNGSVGANGWVRFGNGLVVQWGKAKITQHTETLHSVTFPGHFGSSCFLVVAGTEVVSNNIAYADRVVQVCNITQSGFQCIAQIVAEGDDWTEIYCSYIAIGN